MPKQPSLVSKMLEDYEHDLTQFLDDYGETEDAHVLTVRLLARRIGDLQQQMARHEPQAPRLEDALLPRVREPYPALAPGVRELRERLLTRGGTQDRRKYEVA